MGTEKMLFQPTYTPPPMSQGESGLKMANVQKVNPQSGNALFWHQTPENSVPSSWTNGEAWEDAEGQLRGDTLHLHTEHTPQVPVVV